jgi:hypothetical protein
MAEGIAANWLDAASRGDPPGQVITIWVEAVKVGDKAAFDALTMWLATIGAGRGWRWPDDPKGEPVEPEPGRRRG